MSIIPTSNIVKRRTLLQAGLALGAMQIASPYVIKARGEEPIKIGLDDPFTGTYARARDKRADWMPTGGPTDQREGRHSRAADSTDLRGFDQHGHRNGGLGGT